MKKIVLAVVFGTIIAVSCSKKEEPKESNVMLEEPTVVSSDSTTAKVDSVVSK